MNALFFLRSSENVFSLWKVLLCVPMGSFVLSACHSGTLGPRWHSYKYGCSRAPGLFAKQMHVFKSQMFLTWGQEKKTQRISVTTLPLSYGLLKLDHFILTYSSSVTLQQQSPNHSVVVAHINVVSALCMRSRCIFFCISPTLCNLLVMSHCWWS